MEIGTISSSSYYPVQSAETRTVRPSTREFSLGMQESSVAPTVNRTDSNRFADAQVNQSRRTELESRQATEAKEAEKERAERMNADASNVGGVVKLDVEEGKRVLKVFDSKDVLIYQLPPKGSLLLIQSQESAQKPQVQAIA
jgi:biotin carboxyl carrier protein